MKRIFTLLTFLVVSLSIYSQAKKKSVESQNPNIISYKSENPISLGTNVNGNCILDMSKVIVPGTEIFLYGHYSCYNYGNTYFYKVFYNGERYSCREEEINISDKQQYILKRINDSIAQSLDSLLVEKSKLSHINTEKKAETFLKKGKAKGLLIDYAIPFDQSEYTDGTGFRVCFKNLSKKGIKYIWFTVKGLNRVKDVVGSKTVKIIGEIEPNQDGKASFDYVWHTDIVDSIKLPLIKIQYMDGSIVTIQNAENLIIPSDTEQILFPEE